MTETTLARVEKICAELTRSGEPVTFTAVAERADIGRATLYRNPQLRAVIDEHRTRQTDARTLTGLSTEVAHLRTAVEALADVVKRHEEQLRKLTKPPRRR
jgi:uncharacterized protein DUF6262